MGVDFKLAAAADKQSWDAYVAGHAKADPFHYWGWSEAVETAFAYEPLRVMAVDGQQIVGLLPLVDVKAPLFGRSLISTAFSVGGGIIADSNDIAHQLAQQAQTLGAERGVKYVELRGGTAPTGWARKQGVYATFKKQFGTDFDENLRAIPKRRRAEIRKAQKLADAGVLSIRYDQDIDLFYDLYARSVRGMGTPVFPKSLVEALAVHLGEKVEIATVYGEGAPIGSLLTLYQGERVMPYHVGFLPKARELKAADHLYWSILCRGLEKGYRVLDLGRSKLGTSHYHYKTLWGFEPEPLEYYYHLVNAKAVPNVNPKNPKFALFSKVWSYLPLSMANKYGPRLAKNLA